MQLFHSNAFFFQIVVFCEAYILTMPTRRYIVGIYLQALLVFTKNNTGEKAILMLGTVFLVLLHVF